MRKNISISKQVYSRALALMKDKATDNFSGFLEDLIQEKWEERLGGNPIERRLAVMEAAIARTAAHIPDIAKPGIVSPEQAGPEQEAAARPASPSGQPGKASGNGRARRGRKDQS
jgi:hypothetical protein